MPRKKNPSLSPEDYQDYLDMMEVLTGRLSEEEYLGGAAEATAKAASSVPSGIAKWLPRVGKWGGRALGGLGIAASVLSILDLLDETSGAARAREDFTPDAFARRYGDAFEFQQNLGDSLYQGGEANQFAELAPKAESTNRLQEAFQRDLRRYDAEPSPYARSKPDPIETLLGGDVDMVKQISKQSKPSYPEFLAAHGIIH